MKAHQKLAGEHRRIQEVLDWLEALAERARRGGGLAVEVATALLGFLENHVDGLHQEKEARVLFPRLLLRATSPESRELRRLFRDHEHERALLEQLREDLEGALDGRPRAARRFADHARRYSRLQRHHLAQEEAWLVPLVRERFTHRDDELAQEAWDALEQAQGRTFRSAARGLLEALRARWGDPDRLISGEAPLSASG